MRPSGKLITYTGAENWQRLSVVPQQMTAGLGRISPEFQRQAGQLLTALLDLDLYGDGERWDHW